MARIGVEEHFENMLELLWLIDRQLPLTRSQVLHLAKMEERTFQRYMKLIKTHFEVEEGKFQGEKTYRVTGTDLLPAILKIARKRGHIS